MSTRSRKPATRAQVGAAKSAPKAAPSTSLRWWILGGLVALVVVAAVVAFVATGGDDGDDEAGSGGSSPAPSSTEGPAGGEVTVTGDPLPRFEGTEDDPAIGTAAPVLTGPEVHGNGTVTIEATGRPVLIGGFAHWCPHCQDELPIVSQVLADGGFEGIDVYGLSTAEDESQDNWPPADWFDREGFTAPVVADDRQSTLFTALGLNSFPSWVVLDGDGNVVLRLTGELSEEQLLTLADTARAA
jgi:thiol-disulfide isomerase/thioredoxin